MCNPPDPNASIISQGAATSHLLLIWFVLILMIGLLAFATVYFLKRKDVKVGTALARPRP